MLPRLTHTTENTFLGFSIVINRKQASPAVWKPGKENLFFLCFILLPSIQAVQSIQLNIVLEICLSGRALAGHPPSLEVFAHITQCYGDAVFFLNQLAHGGTCPKHKA